MKRLNKNTQMPFIVALAFIFGYGLLTAAVPTDLSATTQALSQAALLRDSHPQTDHLMTAKANAADQGEDAPSVQ